MRNGRVAVFGHARCGRGGAGRGGGASASARGAMTGHKMKMLIQVQIARTRLMTDEIRLCRLVDKVLELLEVDCGVGSSPRGSGGHMNCKQRTRSDTPRACCRSVPRYTEPPYWLLSPAASSHFICSRLRKTPSVTCNLHDVLNHYSTNLHEKCHIQCTGSLVE